jgi:hypothetical protein
MHIHFYNPLHNNCNSRFFLLGRWWGNFGHISWWQGCQAIVSFSKDAVVHHKGYPLYHRSQNAYSGGWGGGGHQLHPTHSITNTLCPHKCAYDFLTYKKPIHTFCRNMYNCPVTECQPHHLTCTSTKSYTLLMTSNNLPCWHRTSCPFPSEMDPSLTDKLCDNILKSSFFVVRHY